MPEILTRKSLLRYSIEAVLIAFSVLFALFLDQWLEQRKEARYVDATVTQIEAEMRNNLAIAQKLLLYHSEVVSELNRCKASGTRSKNSNALYAA